MNWEQEDEELDFEWKDEEEEEISGASGKTLSQLHPVASAVMLGLVALFVISLLVRVVLALTGRI